MVVSFSLPSTRRGNSLDGSTSRRAIPMPVDPTWLSDNGLEPKSIADQYAGAVQAYIRGHLNDKDIANFIGMRNVSELQGRIL